MDDLKNRISRRRMLKTVAGGTAAAWSAPAIVRVAAGAGAASPLACTRTTQMDGDQEEPGPGDDNGTGTATITISGAEVCWVIDVQNITLPATAAHIHEAPAGSAGPVRVTLSPPDATGHSEGCTTAEESLAADICANPDKYYVNVHNLDFPNGAVRGQLG